MTNPGLRETVRAAAALLAVGWAIETRAAGLEFKPLAFVVPRAAAPPAIDGVIEAGEWKGAAAMTGVLNFHEGHTYNARQVVYWLAWDPEHFYIAMRSENLPGERLRRYVRVRNRDQGELVFDDTMELYFHPRSYRLKVDGFFQLLLNSVNRAIDCKRCPGIGQDFFDWTAPWPMANRVTPDGKAWEAEIAVAVKDMEAPGPMKAGDRWGVLLARNFASPFWQQVALWTQSYFEPKGYPQITLGEGTPVVQCTALGDVLHGTVRPDLSITGAGAGAQPVGGVLTLRRKDQVLDEKTFDGQVAPGRTLRPDLQVKVPAPKKGDAYECQLVVRQGDRVLYDLWFPFEIEHASLNYLTYQAPEKPFRFEGALNPVRNLFGYTLDIIDFADKARYDRADLVIKDAAGKVLVRAPAAPMNDEQSIGLFASGELGEGAYAAEATLYDQAGAVLAADRTAFKKRNEARDFPWYRNTIGMTDEAFPPFTRIEVRGNTVACWGREVTFNGGALPAQIVSQGEPLLARPVQLTLTVGGADALFQPEKKPVTRRVASGKATVAGAGTLGDLAVKAGTIMEMDGWTWTELTFTPARPVRADRLVVDVPLHDRRAPMMAIDWTAGAFGAAVPGGEGRVWSTLDLAINCMTRGNFFPVVWLGSDQRGLCWFADDDRGWDPSDTVPALELVRKGEELILRMNLIAAPAEIRTPRTIRFGLIASPMKPHLPGFRFAEVDFGSAFGVVGMEHGNWSSTIPNKPYEECRRQVIAVSSNWPYLGRRANMTPCICYRWDCTTDRDVLDYFRLEWEGGAPLTRTVQDHLLWNLKRWREQGGISGIYHDCFTAKKALGVSNGSAYVLPDGSVQPGWDITHSREFLKRLWVMFRQSGLEPPDIRANGALIPSLGFMWKVNLGEASFSCTESRDFDFMDMWKKELFQVCNSHTWGVVLNWMGPNGTWLAQIDGATPAGQAAIRHHLRCMTGYLYAHDIVVQNGGYGGTGLPLARWGLNNTNVVFHPYWRAIPFARCAAKDSLLSAWTQPGRLLLVLVNLDHADQPAPVQVDLKPAGVAPTPRAPHAVAYDIEDGRPLALDAQTGRLMVDTVVGREFRLIAIEPMAAPASASRLGGTFDAQWAEALAGAAGVQADYAPWVLALQRWGVAAPDVTFAPATRPAAFAQCAEKDVVLNAWTRPGKLLLMLANPGGANRTVDVTLDFHKAGLWPIRNAQWLAMYDLQTGEPVPFDAWSGAFKAMSVPAQGCKLIAVERF